VRYIRNLLSRDDKCGAVGASGLARFRRLGENILLLGRRGIGGRFRIGNW